MTWVLIIFISTGYSGGMTSVEGFSSKDSCEKAATQIMQDKGWNEKHCYCVEKS